MLVANGYVATTMGAIAGQAGVAIQTSYHSVAGLRDRRARQRLVNHRQAAVALRQCRGLRNGMGDGDAAAVIFTIGHPDNFASLTETFDWSVDRYRGWSFAALSSAVA